MHFRDTAGWDWLARSCWGGITFATPFAPASAPRTEESLSCPEQQAASPPRQNRCVGNAGGCKHARVSLARSNGSARRGLRVPNASSKPDKIATLGCHYKRQRRRSSFDPCYVCLCAAGRGNTDRLPYHSIYGSALLFVHGVGCCTCTRTTQTAICFTELGATTKTTTYTTTCWPNLIP